jgi:carboxymethylenebutenolidase
VNRDGDELTPIATWPTPRAVEAIDLDLGDGPSARAELAAPAGDGACGALVVVHEWWGLNDEIRGQTRRFAAEGFLALAVDLYAGEVTDRADRAIELVTAMKTQHAMRVVDAAARWLTGHPRSKGKVGVTGFCLGGAMALAAAANVEGLSAILPFYGTPKDEFLQYDRMRAPIQGHYAKEDPFVSAERITRIHERVNAAGGRMDLFFYDGGHAFLRDDPGTHHAESAAIAWPRAIAFLRAHLG